MDKIKTLFLWMIFTLVFSPALIYSEENPQPTAAEESAERPLSAVVSGARDIGRSPAELVQHTVEETKSSPPIVGTLRGIERGASELTRTAVKGVSNIVTLGHGQQSELEPPRANSEHKDPATFKIKIPGS